MTAISKISTKPFFFLFFYYLILVFIFINFNSLYHSLDGENNIIELGGALALLVSGVILIKTGFLSSKKNYKFYVYLIVGSAFIWAAGEEISWGQHLFGTVTPEWLAEVNDQNETNLHNINKKFFDRTLDRLIVLLTLLTSSFYLFNKDKLFGFKLPSYPLTMAFMLLPVYRAIESIYDHDVWYLSFLFFLIYPALGIIKKNKKMLLLSLLFSFVTFIVAYFHMNNLALFGTSKNIYHEYRETGFSILCVFYSIQLFRSEKA